MIKENLIMLNNNSSESPQTSAFTLIELLIVVSIFGILASMLMPALQRARQQAKIIICTNNIYQQGLMLNMFASDFDGKTTLQYGTNEPRNSNYYVVNGRHHNFGNMWRADYLTDLNILVCPQRHYPLFAYHLPVLMDNDRSKLDFSGSMTTDYSVRPEVNHKASGEDLDLSEDLVRLNDYADVAILSENLYMRYPQSEQQELFHEIGNTVGFGDGSVRFIRLENIPVFHNLYTDRSTNFYKTEGESKPAASGIWYHLDANY